ncbi:MAG TPA: sigma-70 family RNA polymerase sigma factor [Gemmataceae bacterium]
MDDHSLLDSFQQHGDEAAFAVLMQRYGSMVLSVCRRVLCNEQDAEDVFQATFLILARKAGSVRKWESLSYWLYKVAYRLALRLRSKTAHQRAVEPMAEAPRRSDAADDLTLRELHAILDEELQRMPERYRAPLVLCYLAGKTRDEAAKELGWSVGAVKGRLERGRQLLRTRLERRGIGATATLLAVMLIPPESTAAVPALLMTTTITAALKFSSGASAANLLSSRVLQLVELGLPSTTGPLVKLVVVGLLLVSSVAGLSMALVQKAAPSIPEDETAAGLRADGARPNLPGAARPKAGQFRDITRRCGLEALLTEKYARDPQWWLAGLHLVDLDGDGYLDFFMSDHRQSETIAALNDGEGHFQRAPGTYPASAIHLAYDLDEDGRVDLAMTFRDGGSKWWLNKSRPGTLQFEPTPLQRDTHRGRRQALIDINRDGKVDWIRGIHRAIHLDLADDKGGFTPEAVTIPVDGTERAEVLCLPVDLDGDGHIDFLTEWGHYDDKSASRIFHNDGKMHFTDVTRESGLNGTNMAIKGVADVNQDGFPDLIVLEDLHPEIYLNDGKGKFTKLADAFRGMDKATPPRMASWGLAVMTDFDNDGVPDLLWNGRYFLWVLRGLGEGRFQYMNRAWAIKDLAVAAVDDGLCFGDLDADGRLDIIGYITNYIPIKGEKRRFAVYRNELPRRNWLRVRPIGAAGNKGAAGAKVRLYAAGTRQLLWYEQVAIYDSQSAQSYYAHAETERHYGLGARSRVDVEVEFYPSGEIVRARDVKANTTIKVHEKTP